jgi:membrane dipeptidase
MRLSYRAAASGAARQYRAGTGALPATLLLAACLQAGCSGESDDMSPAEAARIHARLLTLDTHLDTPMMLMRPGFDLRVRHDPLAEASQIDLPRLKQGGLDAGFWAVFVSQGKLTPEASQAAAERAERIFARIRETVAAHPDELALATSAAEVRTAVDAGKHAVLIGMENGNSLAGDPRRVWRYRDLGARYIGLLHSRNNELGDSATDSQTLHGGLSELGREMIREMNRAGIMVDVSHASDETFWDMLETSAAPVIASHSSARAIYDHPRNLTDDMLRALAEKGGVAQVNTLSDYLADLVISEGRRKAMAEMGRAMAAAREAGDDSMEVFWQAVGRANVEFPPPLATVSDVADHIDHMVAIMGIDHVGVGADFDGGGGVEGMFDASEIGNLTFELLQRGYSEEDLGKIWSGNLLRVMSEVQALADR